MNITGIGERQRRAARGVLALICSTIAAAICVISITFARPVILAFAALQGAWQ